MSKSVLPDYYFDWERYLLYIRLSVKKEYNYNTGEFLMLKLFFILSIILFLFSFITCGGIIVDSSANTMSEKKIAIRTEVCDEIGTTWAGVTLRYKGVDDFLSKCNLIEYNTEMDLAQKVRPLVNDGHFDIGLSDFHEENHFSEAKIIPLVVTYDIYDNTTIVKTTDKLREMGLKEGNIILKINNIEVLYYIDKLMATFPYSTYFQTKEVAYRLLFNTIKSPTPAFYFELPTFDGNSPLDITYLDTETGEIDIVNVEFEPLENYMPNDPLDITWGNYWSIHKYYDVSEDNTCISDNEFATLKEIDGKKWLIYHINSLIFDIRKEYFKKSFQCYLKYLNEADYFVLDIRDSVGGAWEPTNAMLGILGCTGEFSLPVKTYYDGELNDYFIFEMKALHIEGLDRIGEKVPVYIWVNALAGSACDMLLYANKNTNDKNIKILGKPSAGRYIAVTNANVLDFDIKRPIAPILDSNEINLEGKSVLPDYYFDVEAKDYKSADEVFLKFVEFIKKNNL